MSDFKTQTEIWQWLLDGGRIQEAYQDHPFELKDGFVVDASGERWHLIFRYPTQWYKVKPKVKYLKSIKQILEENPDYYFDREGNIRNYEDVGRIICYSDLHFFGSPLRIVPSYFHNKDSWIIEKEEEV